MNRILIFGNAGSGKSTLARRLSTELAIPHLDLDQLAWAAPGLRKSLSDSAQDIRAFIAANPAWVAEGCYGDLLELILPHAEEIRFLNPGVEACVANCLARPWEPDKYSSRDEQDSRLAFLINWVRDYETRNDEYSLARHRTLFDTFPGAKREFTSANSYTLREAGASVDSVTRYSASGGAGMMNKVRQYIRSRVRNPVTWFAVPVIGAWTVSAATGLAPYQMLSLLGFVFAGMEWWALALWWRANRRNRAHAVQLTPALDRWKIVVLVLIAATTLVLDLWVGSPTMTLLRLGLGVFGISSIITLWYAWSRPIVIADSGILVGIETVPWTDVRRIVWADAGRVRIDLAAPSYFYGAKITVAVSLIDTAAINALLPDSIERVGSPERPNSAPPALDRV
jgi:adenylate kinase family enzyme